MVNFQTQIFKILKIPNIISSVKSYQVCANPLQPLAQSDQVKVANGSEMVVANLSARGIWKLKWQMVLNVKVST